MENWAAAGALPPSTASRHPDYTLPEPIYRKQDNFLYQGAADLRWRSAFGDETNGTYLAAARETVDYVRADRSTHQEKGGARVQLVYETKHSGSVSDRALRFGELYGFYRFRFPGVTANVKVGQFVIPFGLASVYDTSLLPIHSLYDKSLGLRLDIGTMLEGQYGPYHYAASVTDGSGPNRRDYNNGRLWAFRLERIVDTEFGKFQIGGSLLTGRGPVTDFNTELPPSGTSGARQFKDITRFAGDGQYFLGRLTGRGEIVFGADDTKPVWGWFGEGDYRFLPRWEGVLYTRTWNFAVHPQEYSSTGIGLNYRLTDKVVLRGLYEYEADTPLADHARPVVVRRFTVQTRLNF